MNASFRAISSKTAALFAARMAGAAIMLAVQAALAQLFGGSPLADYFLLIAAINLLAMFMPLGFQTIGHIFAADYAARGDLAGARLFLRRAYAHIAAVTLLALLACVLASGHNPALSFGGPPVVFMAAASAIAFVNGAMLTGLGRHFAGIAADALFRPMAIALGLALVATTQLPDLLSAVLWTAAALYWIAALAQSALLVKSLGRGKAEAPASEPHRWWRMALPAAFVALVADFFFDLHLLMLAPLLPAGELAIYGVAVRVFVLFAFALSAVQMTLTPQLVRAKIAREEKAAARHLAGINVVSLAASLVFCTISWFSAPVFAFVFGAPFKAAATPLAILCLILVARSLLGPALMMLTVRERPEAAIPAAIAGLLILAASSWLLAPIHGAAGAACAAFVAMTAGAAMLSAESAKRFRIDVSIAPVLRELLIRRG